MRDGQDVSCIAATGGAVIGDFGKILVTDGESAHVLWSTGARAGQVDLVDTYDLTAKGRTASLDDLDDSLEVGGSLLVTGAREAYDEGGPAAVINAMNDSGHLASFATIAEDALGVIATRIRHDPAVREVTGQLEDEEAEEVVRLAALSLIRDAFAE